MLMLVISLDFETLVWISQRGSHIYIYIYIYIYILGVSTLTHVIDKKKCIRFDPNFLPSSQRGRLSVVV